MKIIFLRYLLFGFQFLASILILEKLSVYEIYIFGVFQTLLGTLLYAQFGLPQYFTKVNINYKSELKLNKSLNIFQGAQSAITIILFPIVTIISYYLSKSILLAFLISINFSLISLFNIFGSYFRIKNNIKFWLLTLNFYTVAVVLYLTLIPSPKLVHLLYVISTINILLFLTFCKRTSLKIKSFKFFSIINKSIIQLVMNLGAPFLIIINRYLALAGSELDFKIYHEVFIVLMAAGLVVNSISQILSVKILKLISNGETNEQKFIADNLLFTIIFVTILGYLISFLLTFKYANLFTENIIVYYCFIMPSLVILFYNYLIAKNKELFSLIPLFLSLVPYLFDLSYGPFIYLVISMIIYSISFVSLIYFFNDSSSKNITYLTLRNILISGSLVLLLYYLELKSYFLVLFILIIFRKRVLIYFLNFYRFYKKDDTFYV